MSYVMGVDIGTYESKGVLVNQAGEIMISYAVPHRLEIPYKGWAEHDAHQNWWMEFAEISHTLLTRGEIELGIHASDVKAVGISSIAPAVVPVDSEGNPLRKSILYGVDTRAGQQILHLNERIGKDKIHSITGHSLSSQSAGPKILWIKENEPEVYKNTRTFLCGSGFIVYKLTGEKTIDHYTAVSYSPLYDIHKKDWNEEMLLHITERDKLPRLAWSCDIVGEVTREAANITGLQAGTKVIAGTADALSESISAGAVEEGDLMLMYGSSTFFILVTGLLAQSEKLWPNLHAVPKLSTLTGGTATAGSLTRWFIDQWRDESGVNFNEQSAMSISESYRYFTELAAKSPVGSNGLITLPYFSGERTPIHHSNAKGVFFGLTLQHSKGDMYRSILEGVACSIRHNLDEMLRSGFKINRIFAVGGGTKNKLWLQCVSNICGLTQIVPKVSIGAAYGNAFLCSLALGWNERIEEMEKWVSADYEVRPEPDKEQVLEGTYKLYRKLYEQTRDLMDIL
ncbi:FGGY-family carbohydrate kinase [Cytobacillus firmus]|uniref:Carbohydrate kinase FGGY n=1 Tax=Cytobacillus firmus DS1 TaxID=1307436 RepID=W7L318_CYTFI|nr:FGGY-family carbohydrate kinase [Cytobacillus firmus]EWG10006.1 carbohydrate kinase FGGY [Cytobacillus firmus DS1]